MRIKQFEIMNSKQTKIIAQMLLQQWGFTDKLDKGFLQKENDIFLITRDLDKIDTKQLNVNSVGLYFGESRHGQLRLSIEGSQIIGGRSTRNVLEINEKQLQQWLRGEDIDLATAATTDDKIRNSFLIVKHNRDFFGCGKVKEGRVLNFVPKSRRLVL